MLIFVVVSIMNCASSTHLMNSYELKSAYIAEVYYPESEVYQTFGNTWNFTLDLTVHNVECSDNASGQAWFFFKIYRNEEIWWDEYNNSTYKVWRCTVGGIQRRSYRVLIPTWEDPKDYDFKIELYWNHGDVFHLQDTTCFTVTCALLLDPKHQVVLAYLSIYSFVIIILSLYLLATGRIKNPARIGKPISLCLDLSEGSLKGGIESDRLRLMRVNHLRWFLCQMYTCE
jgi:hypothetical protein